MNKSTLTRRGFIEVLGTAVPAIRLSPGTAENVQNSTVPAKLEIDPTPRFTHSPYLYMQFMEPLGVTDSSVDAAWDFRSDQWRKDVVKVSQELAPRSCAGVAASVPITAGRRA